MYVCLLGTFSMTMRHVLSVFVQFYGLYIAEIIFTLVSSWILICMHTRLRENISEILLLSSDQTTLRSHALPDCSWLLATFSSGSLFHVVACLFAPSPRTTIQLSLVPVLPHSLERNRHLQQPRQMLH